MSNVIFYNTGGTHKIRFIVVFLSVYLLFYSLYFAVPNLFLANVFYHNFIVFPAAFVINLCAPIEAIQAVVNKLISSKASLEIVRGCDGAGVAFLLMAAILAFKAKWKQKLAGLTVCLMMIFVINQIRIIGLYFIVAYQNNWFDIAHTYFAPTLIIIVSCLYFYGWTVWSGRAEGTSDELGRV